MKSNPVPILFLTCLSLLLISTSSSAGICDYRLFPDEFDVNNYIFPNSLCIYPDGRSNLLDASEGALGMSLCWLQQLNHLTYNWYNSNDEQCIWLGDPTTNLNIAATGIGKLAKEIGMSICFQPIYGGGHSAIDALGQPISSAIIMWAPVTCALEVVELYINSPDITGDMSVNISDAVLFANDKNDGYNFRSDFNHLGFNHQVQPSS